MQEEWDLDLEDPVEEAHDEAAQPSPEADAG
jgi:hypothetical protein